tara:strand:+ start:82 stop:816 length:735 start_codon:yes stop_codon:yes gene_type:complete
MKVNVGLIGRGQWGLKLKSKLIKNSNLKFVCGKKTNYSKLIKKNNVKWVFIATPNQTHYQIVKKCLNLKVNVFCEKPLTESFLNSKNLFNLANKNKVKLYVSDVYSFHSKKVNKLNSNNIVYRSKKVAGKDKEFLNRFLYHDISILYKFIKKRKIQSLQFNKNTKKKLIYLKIKFKNYKEVLFKYDLNSTQKKHYINNINLLTKKDILKKMIYNVIYKKNNIKNNNEKALFILKFINSIKRRVE